MVLDSHLVEGGGGASDGTVFKASTQAAVIGRGQNKQSPCPTVAVATGTVLKARILQGTNLPVTGYCNPAAIVGGARILTGPAGCLLIAGQWKQPLIHSFSCRRRAGSVRAPAGHRTKVSG